MRVRVDRDHRQPERLEQVRQHLARRAEVRAVEVNPTSGSVLLQGESTDALRDAFREAVDLVEESGSAEDFERRGVEAAVGYVRLADDRLGAATRGKVRLRWLVPAAFVGFGVRQLILEGLTLGQVPWYVLIYYGVDSFLKLYPEHAPQATRHEPAEST